MPADFIKRETADGSDTLYSARLGEAYHSLNGSLTESRHVFLEAGLHALHRKDVCVFEVGLGTGLNALLTWQAAVAENLTITYHSIEAFPLDTALTSTLRFPLAAPNLPANALARLHAAPWDQPSALDSAFTLFKHQGDVLKFPFADYAPGYDLVYFDAFAPDIQPELWEEALFRRLYDVMHAGGILVTYCAKGEVRRRLQRAGFITERLPGPPGKREMLRARRQNGE
ncbi:MAG: tRNA (5-methylaminomethyl-2-thiouridine)(34)-methyltransferase MnmD [Bacteroidales bacterium]|jgi:tRNA U34 5-methylaminomethyl-2-thiouridine-forming methyltransferase MnmC|nr:tRNA (5-methylaminomethyl-2-thiouridine)(34)-methyltransferase MnmD [Bacteroidales bacterium]OPZ97837.1 MAG: tRNA 5-methylaminomethyl-2-thiouridine biosynthesis bifunctional protein MnmC [Bacteroidetes bacterium ADurb.Bin416]